MRVSAGCKKISVRGGFLELNQDVGGKKESKTGREEKVQKKRSRSRAGQTSSNRSTAWTTEGN